VGLFYNAPEPTRGLGVRIRVSGPCRLVCVILCLAVLIEHKFLMDGGTDGRRAAALRGKNWFCDLNYARNGALVHLHVQVLLISVRHSEDRARSPSPGTKSWIRHCPGTKNGCSGMLILRLHSESLSNIGLPDLPYFAGDPVFQTLSPASLGGSRREEQ